MSPVIDASAIGAIVLVAGLIGLALQHFLPNSFTTGGARDMISAIAGLLTLLSALVLGLLIWTAYGVYSGQGLAIQSLATKALQLDLALADYGPEAKDLRDMLKASIGQTVDDLKSAERTDAVFVAKTIDLALSNLHRRDRALKALHPQSDEQKQALASANTAIEAIAQSRLQMALALTSPVSFPLLFTVAGWVAVIFLGHGLTSKGHAMSVIAAFAGALAMSSAFFLILDLSAPYDGVFHVSSAPLQQAMAVLGRDPPND